MRSTAAPSYGSAVVPDSKPAPARDDSSAQRSLWDLVAGDGRPLLLVVAVALMFAGGFAIFLAARGEFLPHDEAFLGMTADELRGLGGGRVVAFMLHDRVAFGGSLLAIGLLYVWLVAGPLGEGRPWAWWLMATTGAIGLSTFLTWLGYGYLDSWHGWGTVALLPFCVAGGVRTRCRLAPEGGPRSLLAGPPALGLPRRRQIGWRLVAMVAGGLVATGLVIVTVGVDAIFVPEDIEFIGMTREDLDAVNPRLVPVIAHDRAGFGAAILVGGLLTLGAVLHAAGSRSLWHALALAVALAFGTAVAVHYVVGYTDQFHLAPAYVGGGLLATGLVLSRPPPPVSSPTREPDGEPQTAASRRPD